MASIPVLTVAVVALWMWFIDSIRNVTNVTTQRTSMDLDGEDFSPIGGASHGTE